MGRRGRAGENRLWNGRFAATLTLEGEAYRISARKQGFFSGSAQNSRYRARREVPSSGIPYPPWLGSLIRRCLMCWVSHQVPPNTNGTRMAITDFFSMCHSSSGSPLSR
jgi:hypothetical protein